MEAKGGGGSYSSSSPLGLLEVSLYSSFALNLGSGGGALGENVLLANFVVGVVLVSFFLDPFF